MLLKSSNRQFNLHCFARFLMSGPAICETIPFTTRTEERLLISLPSWAGGRPAGNRSVTKVLQHPKATHGVSDSSAITEQARNEGHNPLICMNLTIPLHWQHSFCLGAESGGGVWGESHSQLSIFSYLVANAVGDDKGTRKETPIAPPGRVPGAPVSLLPRHARLFTSQKFPSLHAEPARLRGPQLRKEAAPPL